MSDASDIASFTGGGNVKLNTKNIQARLKFLKYGIKKSLYSAGADVREHLLGNWNQGRGGDDAAMKPLSKHYAKKKADGEVVVGGKKRGGRAIPNLLLTGEMQKSMNAGLRVVSPTLVSVGFSGGENINKARGNYEVRPNMMELNDRFKNKVIENIMKDLTRYGLS
jgi:hypothetical protein